MQRSTGTTSNTRLVERLRWPITRTIHAPAVWHRFAHSTLPFLAANDLAIFKSLFDRPKDWLDIEEMVEAGTIDVSLVANTVESLIGTDPRVQRVLALGTGVRRSQESSGDEE